MKKIFLLLILFLTACSNNVEDVDEPDKDDQTIRDDVDVDPPVVTVENPVYQDGFDIEEYISVSDDSEYTISSNFDSVVDKTVSGTYVVTITVTDEQGNNTVTEMEVEVIVDEIAPVVEMKSKLAVYQQFDVMDVILSMTDDVTPQTDLEVYSNYEEVVTGDGSYLVLVTVKDAAGNETSQNVNVFKSSSDLMHLFNYSKANGYDLGSDAQLWDENFYNGTLQMNVYDYGRIYVYYTDVVDDYRIVFYFDYGSLDHFHLEFDQDYSTDYMEFSFSEDTRFNTSTSDVTIEFDTSSIHEAGPLEVAENYANMKADEFFSVLNQYFVNNIGVPLH